MAKRPEDRFGSMETLAAALESCLAEARDAQVRSRNDDTGVLPVPARSRPEAPPEPPTRVVTAPPARGKPERTAATRPRRSGLRVAGILLLAAVILVGNLLVLEIVFEDGLPGLPGLGGGEQTPVQIEAVADHDPYGDGDRSEHPELVSRATDGDLATFWTTEEYRSFTKDGVGIVVDAGSRVGLSRIVVITDTPGYTALIGAGDDPDGEFVNVAEEREVGRRATFDIDTRGDGFRYYVVWITALDGSAHVNEVRAFTES
jgi:hypothetical protein